MLVGQGVKTLLSIPLISRGELNGVLRFPFAEECDFPAEKLELARALATQASLAIHFTQLAESAKRSAVLEERNRLAGEIHDSLAQSFAAVCMQLAVAAEETQNNAVLGQIGRAALHLSFQLRERSQPGGWDPPGFMRIAQEAISNAMRHAEPTAIDVSLRLDRTNLILKVTDKGRGMANTGGVRDGFGFINMRARVKNLNGSLKIRSASGRGTTIVVTMPVES